MINLDEIKEIAADFATIAGVPCYIVPMPLNVPATHLKLEYVGELLDRSNKLNRADNGAFKINLILRADGFNEAMFNEFRPADKMLINNLSEDMKLESSGYIYVINCFDTAIEDIGFQYPEQALGISEPDPSNNDTSSRMIYTRVFQLKINYSKK